MTKSEKELMARKTMKECGICVFKYSCGYSSILVGKETKKCSVPHLFKQKRIKVWSSEQQKMISETEARTETHFQPNKETEKDQ